MRLHLCGVRGSTPATGHEFATVGGNTSCVAITADGASRPTLVLDAGTGIRRVSALLGDAPFQGTILLSHLHWDHIQGLPFFHGADRDDAHTAVLVPEQLKDGCDAAALLARTMSPPSFPITPQELRGSWSFDWLPEGRHRIQGFDVVALEIPHKGGRTFGYRISDRNSSVAYLPDHGPARHSADQAPERESTDPATQLCQHVDLMIHDAQYTAEELPTRSTYGHSSVNCAVELAQRAGAKRLVLFHHDPNRTDEQIGEIERTVQQRHPWVETARETASPYDLGASTGS